MKYLAVFIIPIFIMSCALEKESTNQVDSVFSFTTASVKINSVSNGIYSYTYPPACIDFTNGSGVIKYTLQSNGRYGSDVDNIIGNSHLRFDRARLYFNDTAINIELPQNLKYNAVLQQDVILTKSMIDEVGITDGTYRLEIEMVASEFNGNNVNTALNNTFSDYFGDVTISSIGQGCP